MIKRIDGCWWWKVPFRDVYHDNFLGFLLDVIRIHVFAGVRESA